MEVLRAMHERGYEEERWRRGEGIKDISRDKKAGVVLAGEGTSEPSLEVEGPKDILTKQVTSCLLRSSL